MGEQITQRELTAIHEAAHAVLAHRLGLEVKSATIVPEGDDAGTVTVGYNATRRDMLAMLVMALAGDAAEQLFRGESVNWQKWIQSGDGPHFRETFTRAVADGVIDPRDLEQVGNDCIELLRKHEHTIKRVAKQLLERGTITGDELAAMLKTQPVIIVLAGKRENQ